MDKLITLLSEFQNHASDFQNRLCIINGAPMLLEEVEKMGLQEFGLRAKLNMPIRLYKYYPNTTKTKEDPNTHELIQTNHSIKSLKNNEVYLNTPLEFDDAYDSDIFVDFEQYAKERLRHYCSLCNCELDDTNDLGDMIYRLAKTLYAAIVAGRTPFNVFDVSCCSDGAKLSAENFTMRIESALIAGSQWNEAIDQSIRTEYQQFMHGIRNSFRISCFATSPFSQRMWGSAYADNHKGLCIEYRIDSDDPAYQRLIYSLYPVIYCKSRSEVTKQLIHWQDAEMPEESLWQIYFNGVLRKSFDWVDQNEWRLLMLPTTRKQSGFTVPFFPISKVYLGNKTPPEQRKEIIEICQEKNIPYVGMTRALDRFEMQECKMLCENCPQFTRSSATEQK